MGSEYPIEDYSPRVSRGKRRIFYKGCSKPMIMGCHFCGLKSFKYYFKYHQEFSHCLSCILKEIDHQIEEFVDDDYIIHINLEQLGVTNSNAISHMDEGEYEKIIVRLVERSYSMKIKEYSLDFYDGGEEVISAHLNLKEFEDAYRSNIQLHQGTSLDIYDGDKKFLIGDLEINFSFRSLLNSQPPVVSGKFEVDHDSMELVLILDKQ